MKKTDYSTFLASKQFRMQAHGFDVAADAIHPLLKDFQRDVTLWLLRKGRAAAFLDTGLGKTFIQVEWARLVSEYTQKPTLLIAPLSVARQTIRMAREMLGIEIMFARHDNDVRDGINITNYEMFDRLNASQFGGAGLDESSILKSLDGVTKQKLTDAFQDTPFRSCYTATPAPNDLTEIGNHAEFLGVCSANEMKAMFFIHANKIDETIVNSSNGRENIVRVKHGNDKGQEWRIRHHAKESFYRWMASWAMTMRAPSNLGYSDEGYILPSLNIESLFVDVDYRPEGQLFFMGLKGIADRSHVRKVTLVERVVLAAEMVNASTEQWIIWCGLNNEADAIHKAIPNSADVRGSDDSDVKAQRIEDFQDGKIRVLITKPKIAGFGMNFQNAHNMIFLGLNDSWEWYYQCIRREWRFGQTQTVNAYIVLAEIEREIYDNVMKKETMARTMGTELIKYVQLYEREELHMTKRDESKFNYAEKTVRGETFTAMLGDSCERLKEIADESVDLSVYSPPFADLYTYSASERDLGNARDWEEFFEHYKFIVSELLRVTKQGRLTCVHTSDIPAMQSRDGYIGMRDFPGAVIKAYENAGWIFTGRAIVEKNPQAQAIRTKVKALLFVQLGKDSSQSRPAIFDQILVFKKRGENAAPITPIQHNEIDHETWINWASGIWTGIQESDTLQYTTARDKDDEKHICPLQLGTIERCIKLYSNPGETVLTPFMGIGSEAYQAIRFGRMAIGIELKSSYFWIAVKNLQQAEQDYKRVDLFAFAEMNKG